MNEYKRVLLCAPDEIKADGIISYNMDDTMIGSAIKISQNVYLRDVIGSRFLEHIQELVWKTIQGESGGIDDEENIAYKTLLDDYIQQAIIYRTAVQLCSTSTYKLRNMGLVQNSDTNVNSVTLQEVNRMKDEYETLYNDALNRMSEFICEHKDAFPESDFICGCGESPRYARTGLWLGK